MTAGAVSRVCDVTGMITTAMSLRHLSRLTDQNGIAERAKGATPQPEYGYSLIDQARLLVVALRHNFDVPCQSGLVRTAMQFIMEAQDPDGSFRTRRIPNQHWTVEPNAGEAWGAAMWACGVAAAQSRSPMLRREALAAYTHGLGQRSIQLRPMCLAALGAAEILSVDPTHDPSLDLLADAADLIWSSYSTPDWPWPETRLTQINAVIPEALILASGGLGRLCLSCDTMKTRTLLLMSVVCGLAILLAGGVLLVQIVNRAEVIPRHRSPNPVRVGDMIVIVAPLVRSLAAMRWIS
jgi:hypothetical protein